MLQKIQSFLEVREDEPELNRARFRALSREVPLMYGIITMNMAALATTHFNHVPLSLSLIVPCLLLAITCWRTSFYFRNRSRIVSDAEVSRGLKTIVLLTGPLSVLFAGWGLAFYSYGDAEMNAQVIFFASVTTITSAFCLKHLRQASMTLLGVVTTMVCSYLFVLDHYVLTVVALNLALVAIVYGTLLLRSDRDFTRMVIQKREQRQQHMRLQRLNEDNERLANTDSLTGLANRRQFLAEMDALVERHKRENSEFVVAVVDLDGFKPVNDVFGHPAGDQVLMEAGARLQEAFRDGPVSIARLGGDEFGLLIQAPGSDEEIRELVRRGCLALRKTFYFDEGSANLSATAGLARFPEAGESRSLVFDRADYALYFAKQNAKAEPVFFSHEHERLIFAKSALEQELRHADLEREMSVEFQPVLDLDRGHTRGLEALARWYSPKLGRVRPDLFIKAAENIGLIGHLTEVLFRKAIAEARHWPGDLKLSFNLSATSLASRKPMMRLLSIARQADFPIDRLIFEITESAVMSDFESARDVLNHIHESGARVAIDDFGTGFSSLAYVHRLPVDTLKVDRSFIRDISRNEKSANVLRSILNLCENLGIGCIVEGVETQEQFDLVCDLGGRYIQGYYYSKPLSAGDTHMVLQIEFENESPAILHRAGA